jgi:PST family polysaccharide transporter
MASSPSNTRLSAASVELLTSPEPKVAEKHSYGQILKSSALIGGSSLMNIGIGIVRTKAMALLLGPAGFGLAGLYQSIADLAMNIAGMGVNSSGVRQIAEAAGSEDEQRMARTAAVLRWTSVFLGAMGAILLISFSREVSKLTFGTTQHASAISLLSLVVLFRSVSAGQGALIQGTRRISDLAKMNVLGALFGVFLSIPIVYVFREKGVAPALVAVAAMMLLTSWWYSRKSRIRTLVITPSQVGQEARALLTLGFVFMASTLMVTGVGYLVRIILLRNVGFESTGLYQAAWTLGGLYVGFILQAMGADFYPRLTASHSDNDACNRLVNEQTRVGLLLAGPGVIATITYASFIMAMLYSHKFAAAVDILRWICLGTTLQVVTWPMGFIIVAKGKQGLFFGAELAWTIVAVTLAWICVKYFGVNGAGIAFFGSYVFHLLLIYPIARRLSGFRWSTDNKETGLVFLPLIGLVFYGFYALPTSVAVVMGTLAALASGIFSIRALSALVAGDRSVQIPGPIRSLLVRFASTPSRVQ